ncbi:sensor histidine kinase [Deminuibacter soli]|uniref:histidine kinase n=1 Tax=Deminuibacter soli TaxID=2291815 RepID=A0A3E1NGM6_9BACT|nr:two-component regulator propeller domain-containing protein [Deminuibacter soli]RFM27032.1 histidine kinase [Deminuibacter soli]
MLLHLPKTIYLLLYVLFVFAIRVHGQQQYYFRRYQVENGLSNNTVFCSAQDQAGFMWFGTRDGLNRFDGYSFKVFRNIADDSTSIGSSYIHSLKANADGSLWVGTRKGLYLYDPITERFHAVTATAGRDVRDIKTDAQHNLWLILGTTLYRYETATQQLHNYPGTGNATSICITTGKDTWISTTTGTIGKYNAHTDSFSFYDLFKHSRPVVSKWIEKIYEAGNNQLLAGTSNQGVKLVEANTGNYEDILTYNEDKTETYVRDFVQYAPNECWIATEAGIYVYNAQSRRFTHLQKQYNDPYSISDNAIYTLCRDKEGGVWAGTYFGGLSYYPKQYTYFEKFFPSHDTHALWGNAVREICEDRYGNLWVGTEDAGLNKLDKQTGRFQHFQPSGEKGSIAYSNIHGLMTSGDELWIGTFERGLDIMNIRTGKVIRHYTGSGEPGAFSSNFIITIRRMRSGRIYIGTGAGLYAYNDTTKGFTAVQGIPHNDFVYALYEDAAGIVWAGTENNGLYSYNPSTHATANFRADAQNKNSLSNNKVNGIYEDRQRRLWIATEGGGLCMFNRHTNTFRRYNSATGMPADFVFSILEDSRQQLWVTTSGGLVCLNPATDSIKVYTKDDGLLSNQFNYNSACQDTAGNIYLGSVKGMIRFNPAGFTRNTFAAPLFITGFQVYNKEIKVNATDTAIRHSILYTDKVTLKYDQSTFSIDFSALSYTSPEKTAYAYFMEGLDKKWTFLQTNRKVYFTELPPGSYIFHAKASVNGSTYTNEIQLAIVIQPPFWLSGYAYLFYIALITAAVYLLVRNYHQRHEEKHKRKMELLAHEKESELYDAKIAFFTNITHEIRTPLTLIKGPVEDMLEENKHMPRLQNSLKLVEKNTNRLIDLTNQLLDFRQTEATGFGLSFTLTDITALLADTYQQFQFMAAQKQLQYTLECPPQPLLAWVDAEAGRKILVNMIGNAVKYADHKAAIRLLPWSETDVLFTIEVSNDGFVIPHAMRDKIFEPFYRIKQTDKQKGTGIGLAITRSLVELHKGQVALKEPADGVNTFILLLPFQQGKQPGV